MRPEPYIYGESVSTRSYPVIPMGKAFLTVLTVPLILVACSKTNAAPTTTQTTTPTTSKSPNLTIPSGPFDTAATAAPTNAKYACEYLLAAVREMASDDRSVNQAVAFTQSGVDSVDAAWVNDRTYSKLRADAEALLVEVVRQQIQLRISGRAVDASKYPVSYRDAVKAVKADCP